MLHSLLQFSPKEMTNRTELEDLLYEKCREDPDLLATIISEYVWNLSGDKLTELEDLIINNFGDD
jgi:hypothetical protein